MSTAVFLSEGASVYTEKPKDLRAVTVDLTQASSQDGVFDHSDLLQNAINRVKENFNYGIVFIPAGVYYIRRTIHVPKAIRLIGYGKKRPEIRLAAKSPGFDQPPASDKGRSRYMLWFVDSVPQCPQDVQDANSGTFYSALSNINLVIEDGNPAAVALRTHYAQHCFISHVDLHIGQGRAGIFDVGNEIDDVRFFGGDYGIDTTKTSPAWPFLMVDTRFEGQRKAAIRTREAGLTIVRLTAIDVPHVVETAAGFYEKLYMEDCLFVRIRAAAILISNESNALNQINLQGIDCHEVPTFACFRESGKMIDGLAASFTVTNFRHGRQMSALEQPDVLDTIFEGHPIDSNILYRKRDLPALPAMNEWVNILDLGAIGDGKADNTNVIRQAIRDHPVIYFPQGRYRVRDTIELAQDTCILGLHPYATQIIISDNTESFGGLGPPKPILKTAVGGRNIVSGIGIDAGGKNPRAVGCKWRAGEASYMNDVKFIGGHGNMSQDGRAVALYNESRTADAHPDRAWDSQYWSLWITQGGGGTFKDIWTASPYAAAGLYISNTKTPGRIYAMSVEHHVRLEVKLHRIANWQFLALQLEEEVAESQDCQPLEISECQNLSFANLFLFRVIWLPKPYPQAIRTWQVENLKFFNLHNFTQVKLTIDHTLYDTTSDIQVRPWQLAYLAVSSPKPSRSPAEPGQTVKLASGFEFIDAMCSDHQGNLFFADGRHKRIYRWSHHRQSLSLISDVHFKPLSLACDRDGRLIVIAEYFPPQGATKNGWPEQYPLPDDAEGTAYGKWYSRLGSIPLAYCIDPKNPDQSFQRLPQQEITKLKRVETAWHPANRWRDTNDYLDISVREPKWCFVALDGVTIIPICYDLIRASSLIAATPGEPFYAVDEYYKRTVRFTVGSRGQLSDPVVFAQRGEHHVLRGLNGQVYVPDGDIYVYSEQGEEQGALRIPERPACLAFADDDQNTLLIAARSSLYQTGSGTET